MVTRTTCVVSMLVVAASACLGSVTVAGATSAGQAREFEQGTATGCPSLAGVTSFQGGAAMRFSATATGPETGGLDGGRYTIALGRSASNLSLRLTARRVVSFTSSPGIAVFAGKSTGGTVSVKDTLVKRDRGGRVVVSRKVIATARPLIVSAAVFLDTVRCLYEAQVSFVVRTPKGSVTGTAYSEREPIPSGLKLIGGAGPQAYLTCPGNPLLSGKTCYELGGGLAVAYAELEQCKQDPPPGRCVPQDSRPLGDASMNWVLKPTFATK